MKPVSLFIGGVGWRKRRVFIVVRVKCLADRCKTLLAIGCPRSFQFMSDPRRGGGQEETGKWHHRDRGDWKGPRFHSLLFHTSGMEYVLLLFRAD